MSWTSSATVLLQSVNRRQESRPGHIWDAEAEEKQTALEHVTHMSLRLGQLLLKHLIGQEKYG